MRVLESIRIKGALEMKLQQVPSNSFPGRNRGLITVLIKSGEQEGTVQLSFDLFGKNSLKE
jgi:hypothetical protein